MRLALWTVFLAHWTGRHEWHTAVGERDEVEPRPTDLVAYGEALQHEALLDGTTAFIVHAHAVKTSVAATDEAAAARLVAAARCHGPLHGGAEARTVRRRDRRPVDRLPLGPAPAATDLS